MSKAFNISVLKLTALLSTLLFACFTQVSSAKTSVWRVDNGDNTVYLGGTVHILSEKDYPLPCEFDIAFLEADKLVFETDISALESPEFAAKLMLEGTYPSGVSILDKITPSTREKLTMYFAQSGLPGVAFVKFKPGLLLSTLTIVELNKMGVSIAGVDQHFEKKARQAQKKVSYLESVDSQVDFLLQLGEGNEDKFIEYMVESMGQFPNQFDQILASWRSGDLDAMAKVSDFELLEKDFPSLYRVLIESRNNAWLHQIDSMLDDKQTEYVLVGGLHMAGEIGVVNRLQEKGYTVEQLNGCL